MPTWRPPRLCLRTGHRPGCRIKETKERRGAEGRAAQPTRRPRFLRLLLAHPALLPSLVLSAGHLCVSQPSPSAPGPSPLLSCSLMTPPAILGFVFWLLGAQWVPSKHDLMRTWLEQSPQRENRSKAPKLGACAVPSR